MELGESTLGIPWPVILVFKSREQTPTVGALSRTPRDNGHGNINQPSANSPQLQPRLPISLPTPEHRTALEDPANPG